MVGIEPACTRREGGCANNLPGSSSTQISSHTAHLALVVVAFSFTFLLVGIESACAPPQEDAQVIHQVVALTILTQEQYCQILLFAAAAVVVAVVVVPYCLAGRNRISMCTTRGCTSDLPSSSKNYYTEAQFFFFLSE